VSRIPALRGIAAAAIAAAGLMAPLPAIADPPAMCDGSPAAYSREASKKAPPKKASARIKVAGRQAGKPQQR